MDFFKKKNNKGIKKAEEKKEVFDVYLPKEENYLLKNLLELNELSYNEMKEESGKIGKPIIEYLILKNFLSPNDILKFFSEETGIPEYKGISDLQLIKEYTYYKLYEEDTIIIYYPFEELISFLNKQYPNHKILITSYDLYQIKEVFTGEELKLDFLKLVQTAISLEVSDIHMEVKDYALEVKMRILGEMTLMETISLDKALKLQKYIKDVASKYTKAANFDTEEWEERQDARLQIEELKLDLRLAFTPSMVEGLQNYVMRLLKQEGSIKSEAAASVMVGMGYDQEDVKVFYDWIKKPQGLILVSGATGSGKSRMLNTLIASVTEEHKIVTAEDPVEYKIPNAAQHQVFRKEMQGRVIDMSFLQYMRAFMRQDPDIIFIGEWRKEKELTEAIVYASNTGHLVLTSLHANSAALIPSLLINDYGLQKEDVANNSVGYINQVLIKRVCKNCVERRVLEEKDIEKAKMMLEFEEDQKMVEEELLGKEVLFVGFGCDECTVKDSRENIISTGYTGRQAIYEWVTVDHDVKAQILTNVSTNNINSVIREKAKEGKASRYLDIAVRKLLAHQIDYDTMLSVLNKI